MTTIFGLDAGHQSVMEAEHWLTDLVRQLDLATSGTVACTHLVQAPTPHVAISLELPEAAGGDLPAVPAGFEPAAELARLAHERRTSGRAVLYPGVDRLLGELTVAGLLDASRIDRVSVLGEEPPVLQTMVQTRDFVRPQWMDGLLTLVTTRIANDRVAPFEVPDPVECRTTHVTRRT